MKPHPLARPLALGAALLGGARLAAQAVERADVPGQGVLRVSFDPRIMTWNSIFTDVGRLGLGRGLTGDSVGAAYIPAVGRLQQDIRFASGIAGFVASLGQGVLSVREERRTYPVTAEVGLTARLSVSLMVPIVRVGTRTGLRVSSQGATVGMNPLLTTSTAAASYQTFFSQFRTALQTLDQNIAAGQYGCVANAPCAARDSSTYWHAVLSALSRSVYGVGVGGGAAFLPLDSSDAGRGLRASLAGIQQDLRARFADSAFSDTLLLPGPGDTLSIPGMEEAMCPSCSLLPDSLGFGYHGFPFRNSFRYNLGDVELGAKYRYANGAHYAGAASLIVRLPTGATDSADDWLRPSIGDHVMGFEARLAQEVTLGPLWLNVATRAGTDLTGSRVVRVAPWWALFVPASATSTLAWRPGSYLGVDVAPLVRLAPQFAAGFTAGYWTKARDRYTFRNPQDSIALAAQVGMPTAASVLDPGTSERALRLGFAMSFVGKTVEGGFSIEQTVTGRGVVPATTLYRFVMRTSRKLF